MSPIPVPCAINRKLVIELMIEMENVPKVSTKQQPMISQQLIPGVFISGVDTERQPIGDIQHQVDVTGTRRVEGPLLEFHFHIANERVAVEPVELLEQL